MLLPMFGPTWVAHPLGVPREVIERHPLFATRLCYRCPEVVKALRSQMSNEKGAPSCLGYIGDDNLRS